MAHLIIDGEKLRSARETRGYSARIFAAQLQVSRDHLYRLERGKRRPSPALYKQITDLLGMGPTELLPEVPRELLTEQPA